MYSLLPNLRAHRAKILKLLFAVTFFASSNAVAASLQTVSNFTNPGALTMQKYVPDNTPAGAAIVVVLHGCTQSGPEYYVNAGWQKLADQYKFALLVPSQTSSNNMNKCFNWFQSSDFARGQGEAASIYNAMARVIADHSLDANRAYVTGVSAGGAMTMNMAGSYPDKFKGAAVMAGVFYKCATDSISGITCTSNAGSNTPQQLGDKVRSGYSGYTGPWPKVQIFHGSSDGSVTPAQMTEMMEQWTNVHGIDQTADETATVGTDTTRKRYKNGSGVTLVETYSIAGMGHGVAIDPGTASSQCGVAGQYYIDENFCSSYTAAEFWGLTGGGGGGSSSSSSGGGVPPAPTGLNVTGTTSSSVSLAWSASSGATSYKVYRGTTHVGSPTGTSYTDSGLSASTTYTYQVSAVNSSGESAKSGSVSATTGASGGTCYTATNYAHVTAGRAHQSLGYTYANGSNQNMGLYNIYTTTKLRQTGTNYYVIDSSC